MHLTPHRPGRILLGAVALAAVACLPVTGAEKQPPARPAENAAPARKNKAPDVVYVPTPQSVVDRMLELAEVKPGDVVYDLGCGDGRIVVTAAKKFGVKAIGYDIDPQRVKEARENVRQAGVEHLVRIEEADVFTLDLSGASVVTLYLLPSLNVRLMPQLAKLKPGSRIVSHNFDMRGAKPLLVEHVQRKPDDSPEGFYDEDMDHTVYKWIVPWEPELPPETRKN
jgi:ubiquinone/menaquinone biosynthesis C-methylase UbiE